jgi:hypothetical protein
MRTSGHVPALPYGVPEMATDDPATPRPAAAATSGLRIVLFGTYDERQHPRVRVLREGLTELGHEIRVVNVPLGFDTASRVRLASQPWRLPSLLLRLAARWGRLLWRSRRARRPDAVGRTTWPAPSPRSPRTTASSSDCGAPPTPPPSSASAPQP